MATVTNTALTTNPSAIFTSTGISVISTMHFCNVNQNTPTQVSVWVVPSGGTVANLTMIYNNVTVAAKDTFVVDREKIILGNGDSIQAYGNINNYITATVTSFAQ